MMKSTMAVLASEVSALASLVALLAKQMEMYKTADRARVTQAVAESISMRENEDVEGTPV